MMQDAKAPAFEYVGSELDLFQRAVNWKQYWRTRVQDFIGGDVLEVGAGIGANTRLLSDLPHNTWTCLEPDARLAAQIPRVGFGHSVRVGAIEEIGLKERFNSILYIDVLEHIEDDRAQLAQAAAHLVPGGYIVVISPAHPVLYTPFDRAIGHFRRYTRAMLRDVTPVGVQEMRMQYLDSVGMLASAANRLMLRQSMPTEKQILAWDRLMVPVSRRLDALLLHRLGKSILGVWQRGAAHE